MVRSKAKRLKRQHQALYNQVRDGEPEEMHSSFTQAQDWTTDWYNAWLKKLDMDPARHHEMERKTWKEVIFSPFPPCPRPPPRPKSTRLLACSPVDQRLLAISALCKCVPHCFGQ